MRAIWSIAATTVGEAIRRKVLLTILLIGLVFLSIAPGLGGLTARQTTTVLTSMLLGILQVFSAAIAVVLTVYLIPNEIERRTIYTILSKPVMRWQFLLGKYLGALLALGLMMLLMSIVLLLSFVIVLSGGSAISGAVFMIICICVLGNELVNRTIFRALKALGAMIGKSQGALTGNIVAIAAGVILVGVVAFGIKMMLGNGTIDFSAIDFGQVGTMAKAPLLFFVQMSLLAGVAIFFSTFVSPLLNFFLSGGTFFVGFLLNPVYETFASSPNTNKFVQAVAKLVTTVLPNFGNYNIQNPIINPTSTIHSDFTYYLWSTCHGLFYIAVLMVGAILIFDRREV